MHLCVCVYICMYVHIYMCVCVYVSYCFLTGGSEEVHVGVTGVILRFHLCNGAR